MANYGHVLIPRRLSEGELDSTISNIAADKLFGLFTLGVHDEGVQGWRSLSSPIVDDLAMEFEYNSSVYSARFPKTPTNVHFRHGHSLGFMWYVEGVVRENLAQHYGATLVDDGDEKIVQPRPEEFASYAQYLIRGLESNVNGIEIFGRRFNNDFLDFDLERLPTDFKRAFDIDQILLGLK